MSYQLTDNDKWEIGRYHDHLEHTCDLIEGICSFYKKLETATMQLREEQAYLSQQDKQG